MDINLLVLRCKNLEASREFYEMLGFQFVEERHGKGPLHFASQDAGFVFELYPLLPHEAAGTTRLGFTISGLEQVLSQVAVEDRHGFGGKQVHIVRDPDGRKVELSQKDA